MCACVVCCWAASENETLAKIRDQAVAAVTTAESFLQICRQSVKSDLRQDEMAFNYF